MARRFFSAPEKVAEITGINEELLRRFATILTALTSCQELDEEKFNCFAHETAKIFIEKYNWYRMPPSVHKILFHGAQVVRTMLLPIGMFSEEAQEASNKIYKKFREHHTRKSSRINTTRDLFQLMLVWSDPLISSMRGSPKISSKTLPQEVLDLLRKPDMAEEDTDDEDDELVSVT